MTVKTSDVLKLVVEGNTPTDIVALLEENGEKNPRARLEEAFESLRGNASIPEDVTLSWAKEGYRECYRRLLACGDYAGAVRALNSMMRMEREHRPAAGKTTPDKSDEELEAEAMQGLHLVGSGK